MADAYIYFDNYAGPIEVRGRATLKAQYAVDTINTVTGPITSGDGLIVPTPLVIPVSITAATSAALHDNLFTVITKAKAATAVTYHDGTNPIADRSVNGLLAWKVTRYEPLGLFFEANLVFAPTGPYWINRSTSQQEVWEW